MTPATCFFVILPAIYLLQCIWLSRGLSKIICHAKHDLPACDEPAFSIIIAARNEEANIGTCLDRIFAQTAIECVREIIVVDDRSTDSTPQILADLSRVHSKLRIVKIDEVTAGISPKKNAVSQGVSESRGEFLVLTDADCRVPPKWIEAIAASFAPDIGMVQGISLYWDDGTVPSWLMGLQAVDFLSHGIVAAAGIGAGLPINSNANNFAFRKAAFAEAGGYGDAGSVISGDDDLLMQRIWKSRKWKLAFMADHESAVVTAPSKTLAEVINQRKRWASKTVHYHWSQALFLGLIFLFYIQTLALIFFAPFSLTALIAAIGSLIVKLSGELFFMIDGTRIFAKQNLRQWIVPASMVQLFTVIYAVFGGVFGKFTWKDQRFGRKV